MLPWSCRPSLSGSVSCLPEKPTLVFDSDYERGLQDKQCHDFTMTSAVGFVARMTLISDHCHAQVENHLNNVLSDVDVVGAGHELNDVGLGEQSLCYPPILKCQRKDN